MAGYRGIGVVFARRTSRAARVETTVMQRLPSATRETFIKANMSCWVPIEHATDIFDVASSLMYPSSTNAIRELGRALARDNLGGAYRHFVRMMSVPFLIKQNALLWRAYHNAGRTEVELFDSNSVVLRVHEYPDLPERFRECMCGWLEQAIVMTGGKDVCVEKSDIEPVHKWHMTWR
ncbi:MAG: hypothetical protein IPM54_25575 [Polyangiaceae bacterium]|nr:hypothetical protein [Polyangiaceae bacterium]